MTKITSDDVRHVARLARLKITDDEVETFTNQLEAILEHAGAISALDTEGVEPTSHPLAMNNVFREDIVRKSLSQDEALSNAPEAQDGRFKVPQILGEE